MCKNCKGGKCGSSKIAHWLLVIGGLNWGLVGIGMILGSNLNVVDMIFGSGILAAIVYILVGLSAVVAIFGCRCKKCKNGVCGPASTPPSGGPTGGSGMQM